MPTPLRILFVEDLPTDYELAERQLRVEGLVLVSMRVETADTFLHALDEFKPDLIISDYSMPEFDGMQALQLTLKRTTGIPFIMLTGSMNEDTAVKCMKAGADDYVIKEHMHRLPFAVQEALKRQQARNEQKLAEEQLRESEASLVKAQHLAHVGSWTWHIQENQWVWSDEMFYIFGIEKEAFKADLGEVLLRAIHPDDLCAVEQANRSVIEDKKPIALEYRVVRPDGTERIVWAEPGELILDLQEKPKTLTGIVQDITERRKSEQQLILQATALNSAFNAIVITDRNGTIEWINPAYTRLTGYSSAEAVGQNPRLLKSGVQDQAYYKSLWDTIQSGLVWRGELVNKRKDGSLYSEEETITPLFDADGKITHFIGIKEDITERKRSESILQRKNYLQEKMAAMGRELAATLDLQVIYTTAQHYIAEMIDCPNFAITFFDPKRLVLTVAFLMSDGMSIDPASLPPMQYDPQYSTSGRSIAIATKTPVIVRDLAGRLKAGQGVLIGSDQLPQTAVNIPMLAEDQVIGLIDLQSYQEDAYSDEDGEWLSVVANQVGLTIQNARLFEQTRQRVAELQTLHTIDQAITGSKDPLEIYPKILEQIMAQPYVDAVDILIYNPLEQVLEFIVGSGFLNSKVESTRLNLGEGLAGKAALEKRSVQIIKSTEEIPRYFQGSIMEKEGFAGYLGLPLILHNEVKGVLEILSRQMHSPEPDWLKFMETLAQQVAIAVDNNQLFQNLMRSNQELVEAYNTTITGWSKAMDLRDRETEGHTERVTELTIRIAKELGLSADELVHVRRGALLHDIGKLGVPDHILFKPGPLTDDEWIIMKMHPDFAYQMLNTIDYLRPALAIPYCHHEKWDGSGYPRGLKGVEIPLEARIFALVDVFDALTSQRHYRDAWTREETLKYIQEQCGKQFDPQITAEFLRLMDHGFA